MFFRLLLESFRRQRRRKLLAGVAILLGTTAVTAMLSLATTIGDRIHQELAVYGANILITPKAEALSVKVGGVDIRPATGNAYLKESDLPKLTKIFWANNITGLSPELDLGSGFQIEAIANSAPQEVQIRGLWFAHELAGLHTGAPSLHSLWKLRGEWPSDKTPAAFLLSSRSAAERSASAVVSNSTGRLPVVLGSKLAGRLGLKLGSTFLLRLPQTNRTAEPLQLDVTGIVSTGDAAEDQVLAPLSVVQSLNNTPDAISRVEVSAKTRPEDAFARKDPDTLSPKQRELWYCRPYANSIAYQIREAIPGADARQVRQVEQSEGNILNRIGGLMWLVSAAALLAAGFAVSAAMATAILERRGEIGLMRSLGASKGAIATLFYVETGILALLSGTLGYLAGSGLAAWLGARIFAGAGGGHGSSIGPILNPVLLPVVIGMALLVAIAGSTPAIRSALRLDPTSVLRADA